MDILNESFIGWMAIASGFVWIVQYIFLGLMFALAVSPYGRLSDISFVIAALLMLPFMGAFYLLFRPEHQLWSLLGLLVGIVGIGYFSIAQIRLIFGQITFEQNTPQAMMAIGLIGVSLLIFNLLARTETQFPTVFVWLGIIFSALMAQGVITSPFFSQQALAMTSGGLSFAKLNPFMYVLLAAFAISQIGYPVWAIWLGRLILSGGINF